MMFCISPNGLCVTAQARAVVANTCESTHTWLRIVAGVGPWFRISSIHFAVIVRHVCGEGASPASRRVAYLIEAAG